MASLNFAQAEPVLTRCRALHFENARSLRIHAAMEEGRRILGEKSDGTPILSADRLGDRLGETPHESQTALFDILKSMTGVIMTGTSVERLGRLLGDFGGLANPSLHNGVSVNFSFYPRSHQKWLSQVNRRGFDPLAHGKNAILFATKVLGPAQMAAQIDAIVTGTETLRINELSGLSPTSDVKSGTGYRTQRELRGTKMVRQRYEELFRFLDENYSPGGSNPLNANSSYNYTLAQKAGIQRQGTASSIRVAPILEAAKDRRGITVVFSAGVLALDSKTAEPEEILPYIVAVIPLSDSDRIEFERYFQIKEKDESP